ncbi:AMP-binding protein [Spongiibacter sp. KMU-166]|uniref:Long-chain-fatty-acid--CoA ligase n=1 Tax=Spongiibacter thalassae TaxID=2721624 RepID=A0ABX1GCK4_9GAMM|nr:AMP-binding protein [Spongiibacter thalassae]NKI16877.1 AMP-binding protein [Spongiibacter thalassae]
MSMRFAYCDRTVEALTSPGHSNLIDIFDEAVSQFAGRVAFSALGQDMTYAELEQQSRSFAAWLRNEGGLQAGDRVAIQLPNLMQYPVAAWGILRAGLILVNTNPLYTERELEHQLNDSGARAIVMLSEFLPKAEKVLPDTPVETLIITNIFDMMEAQPAPDTALTNTLRVVTFPETLHAGGDTPLSSDGADMTDIAVLQYTGGTTGVAKGAMLTHGNFYTYVRQAEAMRADDAGFDPEAIEVLIAPLPIYHIFGFTLYLIGNFSNGGQSILIPDPRNLDGMMDTMKSCRFSGFAAVNTMLVGMLQNPKFDEIDWSHNRGTIVGGAALVPEVAREWSARTGTPLFEGYGLSETTAVVSINTQRNCRLGTVGKAQIGEEVKIVDPDGNELPDGEAGELVVRGGQVMRGYWNRPEATDEAIDDEGFFRTGDIALREPDGFFRIVDRLKDMIIVSGFNVYPNEVENVVYEHPDIVEAAVIGKPDTKSGEAVALYAVSTNPDLTAAALQDFCRQHLTGYKVPKSVTFVDELPKSAVGKILRRALRDQPPAS